MTRRPKYACRTCERTGAEEVAGIIQATAPARLVEGGLPTEALVANRDPEKCDQALRHAAAITMER